MGRKNSYAVPNITNAFNYSIYLNYKLVSTNKETHNPFHRVFIGGSGKV